ISFCVFILMSTYSFSQGSWKLIDSISAPTSAYGIDVSFVNDSVGYFADYLSNRIYRTTNKGESWSNISSIGGTLRSLEFVNDTIGFLGCLSSSGVNPGAMFRTVNGGVTWTQLTNMQMGLYDGICGIEKFGNTVIATGTYSGPSWFYRSDDFGNSWTRSDLSAISSGLIDCYMYSSDTILITGVSNSTNGYRANILKSTDGGVSWQQVFVASKPSTTVWKIFMRPSGKGIASIQSYLTDTLKAAITNDFGDTWQEVNVAPPDPNWMAGVCFLNDTLGWISTEYNGPTFETQDGGFTWNPISLVNGVNRFVALDSATVIGPGSAAGYMAVVYKYDGNSSVGIPEINTVKTDDGNSLAIFPNPAINSISIEVTSIENTVGILRVVDIKGNVVMNLTKQFFTKGTSKLNQKLDLPAGHYYLLLLSNNSNIAKPFEVTR
ncbi:MAG TPA: T9SS type A sorting domain-containing protein, partial [Bacteroidia bacterium]|nr:T9SS type A sorting domain-containing protein [Bacteroidia bacterium]